MAWKRTDISSSYPVFVNYRPIDAQCEAHAISESLLYPVFSKTNHRPDRSVQHRLYTLVCFLKRRNVRIKRSINMSRQTIPISISDIADGDGGAVDGAVMGPAVDIDRALREAAHVFFPVKVQS